MVLLSTETSFFLSFLPALGQAFGLGQSWFTVCVGEVACRLGCGAGRLESPSSGGSGEMAGALLSSSMGVGLALMGGVRGAKE